MQEDVVIRIPAKINLSIDVKKRLPNGYHEVEMIMQSLAIFDHVKLKRATKTSLKTNITALATDDSNLALRAFRLFAHTYNIHEGVHIEIEKNIPLAGGMAGGSADAAAVFLAANELFDLHLTCEELENLGGNLGADIPFCIRRGTALATGIGADLTSLPPLPTLYVLAINNGRELSTAQVYKNLDLNKINNRPNTHALIEAIKSSDADGICSNIGNVLETSSFELAPELPLIKEEIKNLGLHAMMSGSGATMLGITPHVDIAEKAYNAFLGRYPFVKLAKTL